MKGWTKGCAKSNFRGSRGGNPGHFPAHRLASILRRTVALKRTLFGDGILLAFILAQAADGAFTYLGVATGSAVEGNPLVAWSIAMFGAGVAVVGAKTMAIACGATLHMQAMHRTIGLLTILYLAAAVLPWSRMLLQP